MDIIKIRLQLQTSTLGDYKGATFTLREILKNEGIRALWKGNVPAEIMYIIYGAVQFTSYSALSKTLSGIETNCNFKMSPSTHSLFVGFGTGVCSTISTYPFDLLRTRLAANSRKKFLSMSDTIKNIYLKDGISGYFAGVKPAILSVAATMGVTFWSYEVTRDFSRDFNGIPFIEGICGFFAGAFSKAVTFPLDTIRKRVQIQAGTKISAVGVTRNVLRNEGVFGLYKGYSISILKTAPTSAITLFVYEYTLSFMRIAENKLEN